MKQFTHISIQQVHYSGSVENTVAFYDEAARQLAIANAAPQLVEALKAVISEYDRDMANGLTVASDAIASARAALKAAGVRKRRLPHRDYALCCNNGHGWLEVTVLRGYTRREAMDEMATYKGANPGSSFKLLVMEREDRE